MYIGLISDSHGVFSQEFKDFLAPVDQIWHAGDFGGGLVTAAEIAAFKPLLGVSGNCDDRMLLFDYPEYRCWDCEGMKVLMTHIGGSPGHLNPGACGLQGWQVLRTALRFRIAEGAVRDMEVFNLPR